MRSPARRRTRGRRRSGAHRRDICVPLTNQLFALGAGLGVFAARPGYGNNCTVAVPGRRRTVRPRATRSRARWRPSGSATGASSPYPARCSRSPTCAASSARMTCRTPQYGAAPVAASATCTTPFRFIDGLAEDMLGYIFPQGNSVGVPGENGNSLRSGRHRPLRLRALRRLRGGQLADGQHRRAARWSGCSTAHGSPRALLAGRYVLPDGERSPGSRSAGPRSSATRTPASTSPAGRSACGDAGPRRRASRRPGCRSTGAARARPDRNTRGYFSRRQAGASGWTSSRPSRAVAEATTTARGPR